MRIRTKIAISLLLCLAIAACAAAILLKRSPTAAVLQNNSLVILADRAGGLIVMAIDDSKPSQLYILRSPTQVLITTVSFTEYERDDESIDRQVELLLSPMPTPPQWWRYVAPHFLETYGSVTGPLRLAFYISPWHVAVLSALLAAFIFWRARCRSRVGACPHCSYSLAGLATSSCPECGGAISGPIYPAATPSPPPRA